MNFTITISRNLALLYATRICSVAVVYFFKKPKASRPFGWAAVSAILFVALVGEPMLSCFRGLSTQPLYIEIMCSIIIRVLAIAIRMLLRNVKHKDVRLVDRNSYWFALAITTICIVKILTLVWMFVCNYINEMFALYALTSILGYWLHTIYHLFARKNNMQRPQYNRAMIVADLANHDWTCMAGSITVAFFEDGITRATISALVMLLTITPRMLKYTERLRNMQSFSDTLRQLRRPVDWSDRVSFEQDKCNICYESDPTYNSGLIELRCKHVWHAECLSQWLTNYQKCPACHAKVT